MKHGFYVIILIFFLLFSMYLDYTIHVRALWEKNTMVQVSPEHYNLPYIINLILRPLIKEHMLGNTSQT